MDNESLHIPGLKRRLACLLYELMLLGAIVLAASALFTPIMHAMGHSIWLNQLFRAILLAVLFIYFGLSWVKGGQTVAMRAWRLQLLNADGQPLNWQRASLRFIVVLALFIGLPIVAYFVLDSGSGPNTHSARLSLLWWLVPYLYAYFDPQAQYLQDRLCGTRLILLPKAQN